MLEYVLAISAVATGWSAYFRSVIEGFGINFPKILSSAPGMGTGGIIDLPAILNIRSRTGTLFRFFVLGKKFQVLA